MSCLVPDLKGKAFLFTIKSDVSCDFSQMPFTRLRELSSIPSLLGVFVMLFLHILR